MIYAPALESEIFSPLIYALIFWYGVGRIEISWTSSVYAAENNSRRLQALQLYIDW